MSIAHGVDDRPPCAQQAADIMRAEGSVMRRKMRSKRRNRGEGSIFQRESDGRWCGVLNLGWNNGRRKRKYFYGTTAAEVQEQLLKARADHARGLPVPVERQTVAQYLEQWLEH